MLSFYNLTTKINTAIKNVFFFFVYISFIENRYGLFPSTYVVEEFLVTLTIKSIPSSENSHLLQFAGEDGNRHSTGGDSSMNHLSADSDDEDKSGVSFAEDEKEETLYLNERMRLNVFDWGEESEQSASADSGGDSEASDQD